MKEREEVLLNRLQQLREFLLTNGAIPEYYDYTLDDIRLYLTQKGLEK